MLATACREEPITEDISIAVCEDVEIDLERAARFKIAPFDALRTIPGLAGPKTCRLPLEPDIFCIDAGDGSTREVRGFILYRTLGAVIEYLRRRYVPKGSSRLDKLVRGLQRKSNLAAWRELEDFLVGSCSSSQAGRRSPVQFPVLRRPDFMNKTVKMDTKRRSLFFLDALDLPAVAIARDDRRMVSGARVDRTQLIVARDFDEAPSPRKRGAGARRRGWAVWAFDGERTLCERSIWDLDEAFLARMERTGRLYAAGDIDPFIRVAAKPVALLRVPSRKQWRAYRALCAPSPDERLRELLSCRAPDVLDRPVLLYDSRIPVELPGELPVISDLAAVSAVLARADNGISLPQDVACFIDEADLPQQSGHIIACVPEAPL